MGLTIHHTLTAPAKWSPELCMETLTKLRGFCSALKPFDISPIYDLKGPKQIAAALSLEKDKKEDEIDYSWLIGTSERCIQNPWHPGTTRGQQPNRYMCFMVCLTDGSEPIRIGLASYPQDVWKPEKLKVVNVDDEAQYPWLPYWDPLLTSGKNGRRLSANDRAGLKLLRAYLKKHKLVKCGKTLNLHKDSRPWDHWSNKANYYRLSAEGIYRPYAEVLGIRRYESHRRGYGEESLRLILSDHHRQLEYIFRFTCPTDEAKKIVASAEFNADTRDIICGRDHITPAARWTHDSFCKTQYASDPACGGIPNFLRAHLGVVAVLDFAKALGLKVEVSDEGGYWEKRDPKALAEEVGSWNVMIAGLTGAMKNALGDQLEAAITAYPNFEHLEAKAMDTLPQNILAANEKLAEAAKIIVELAAAERKRKQEAAAAAKGEAVAHVTES